MAVRLMCVASALLVAAVLAGPGDHLTLRIVPQTTADAHNAACLDGTSPGYYYRLGDPKKWKIHMRGGAWCFSAADCAARSRTDLGSNKYFLANFTQTPNIAEGFMDMSSENPFGNWSFAFMQYCDGTSWTSNNNQIVTAPDGTELYFRGSNNIGAILADMEATFSTVSQATDFVLSGTSAGGLATILTADRWQALLRPDTSFAAIADSGFFLNYPQYSNNVSAFAESFASAVGPALWNATSGGVSACVAAVALTDVWQCWFAEVAFAYTPAATRIMLVESQVDQWSVGNILALPCSPNTGGQARTGMPVLRDCNATEMSALQGYATATVQRVQAALAGKAARAAAAGFVASDAVYGTSCFQHGATCSDEDWMVQRIAGHSAADIAWNWYITPNVGKQTQVWDVPFPGDASCQYQAQHGWC